MRTVVLATGNRHKLAELDEMLAEAGVDLEAATPREFGDPPEVIEDGTTFAANAEKKARALAAWLRARGCRGDTLVLADDSGLCVDALGGGPGVTSARFAGEPSDDAANNLKLVQELRANDRTASSAHYACVLALMRVDGEAIDGTRDVVHFEGRWDVEVRVEARGHGGFGYDPHAWIDGGARTVAELGQASKATRSHRGEALRALVRWWKQRQGMP